MKIICDSCGTKYSIADEKVRGKVFKIKCKKCSHIIVVRGASPEQQQGYDEKETRVVDYQGSDPQAAAAALSGEAVWHLVIDQQQVGPMTVDEVGQRFAAGDIDAESYVWKEGFGDWQRLADVPDLAPVLGGGGSASAPEPAADPGPGLGDGVAPTGALAAAAAASGPSGGEDAVAGMFGGPAVDDDAGQNDPADLFSSAGGDNGAADPAGDLFGGGGASPAADDASAGLFGGAPVADAPAPVAAEAQAPDDAGAAGLTGQRNENSVLFSLSNLASLAADAPKASSPVSAPASSGGGGGGGAGMAESGGQEGSGLIDIRSMAAVYLGDQQQGGGPSAPAGPAPTDDLPSFGGGSAFGGSQVLLPVSQPAATNPKTLYALIGAIGLLAVVAIVLVVVVVGGGGDQPQVAAQAVAGGEVGGAGEAAAGGGVPVAAVGDDGDSGDNGAGEPAAAEPEPEPEPEPAAAEPAAEPEPEAKDDDKDTSRRSRRDRKDRSSSRRDRKPKAEPKKEERKTPPRTEKCDEVACLVDPSLPCCGGSKKRGSSSRKSSDKDLPERPSRSDVTGGIGKVRGRVLSCGDKHGFKGTVTVKIKIAGSGKVSGAEANKGTGPFKACVTSAAKRAKFPKTQKGITVNYPFVFR